MPPLPRTPRDPVKRRVHIGNSWEAHLGCNKQMWFVKGSAHSHNQDGVRILTLAIESLGCIIEYR